MRVTQLEHDHTCISVGLEIRPTGDILFSLQGRRVVINEYSHFPQKFRFAILHAVERVSFTVNSVHLYLSNQTRPHTVSYLYADEDQPT